MKRNSFIKSLIGLVVAPVAACKMMVEDKNKWRQVQKNLCVDMPEDYMRVKKIGLIQSDGNVNTIENPYLPEGENYITGVHFDKTGSKVFWYTHNSEGANGIFNYDIKTKIITPIFIQS